MSRYQNVSILDDTEAKDDGVGGDNWNYKICKACHHQQTNTQLFAGWMPFLLPNQQCRSTEWKRYIPRTCSTQAYLRVFQLCLCSL